MRYPFAAFAALLALGFAGCGGDDSGGQESFAERADAICSDATIAINRVARPQDPRDPLQLALFLERVIPVARSQNARLKKLERPEDERDQINRLLGALEAEVDAAERMRVAARRENRAGINQALEDSAIATAQAGQAAAALELEVCGGRSGDAG